MCVQRLLQDTALLEAKLGTHLVDIIIPKQVASRFKDKHELGLCELPGAMEQGVQRGGDMDRGRASKVSIFSFLPRGTMLFVARAN
jgi:hypothetical protein